MDVLFAAEAAVQEAVPAVVQRHRSTGVLTWKLLRQMEEELQSIDKDLRTSGNEAAGDAPYNSANWQPLGNRDAVVNY